MKYFSAFSGVGGFDMAVPPDWECVGMSEIDRYANMVLRYHYKEVENYGNIANHLWNSHREICIKKAMEYQSKV